MKPVLRGLCTCVNISVLASIEPVIIVFCSANHHIVDEDCYYALFLLNVASLSLNLCLCVREPLRCIYAEPGNCSLLCPAAAAVAFDQLFYCCDVLCFPMFLACTISYFCVYYVLCVVFVFLVASFSTLILLVGSFDL